MQTLRAWWPGPFRTFLPSRLSSPLQQTIALSHYGLPVHKSPVPCACRLFVLLQFKPRTYPPPSASVRRQCSGAVLLFFCRLCPLALSCLDLSFPGFSAFWSFWHLFFQGSSGDISSANQPNQAPGPTGGEIRTTAHQKDATQCNKGPLAWRSAGRSAVLVVCLGGGRLCVRFCPMECYSWAPATGRACQAWPGPCFPTVPHSSQQPY